VLAATNARKEGLKRGVTAFPADAYRRDQSRWLGRGKGKRKLREKSRGLTPPEKTAEK